MTDKRRIMKYFYLLICGGMLLNANNLYAQSSLLESVKRNPKEAASLCQRFRALNANGISASSQVALKEVATKKNLNKVDAEILSMYVIGLNCPDVN